MKVKQAEKRETSTLNHSLGVLPVLWSLFLLPLSEERSVFRGTGEEERGCERQMGEDRDKNLHLN